MIVKNPNASCQHCGLPVPTGLIVAEREFQYCCHGCESAHQLISANGLHAFYAMVDSSRESQTLRDRLDPSIQYEQLDDPAFLERFAKQVQDGSCEIRMALDGIHCAACVWLIEKLPNLVSGVTLAQVNWSSATIRLRWNPQQTKLANVARALYRLGYTPHPIRVNQKAVRRALENRQHLARIGVAAAAAGNNMLIAAALYLGMFSNMEGSFVTLLRWISCVIGLVSLVWPGRIFLKGGWIALKSWTPHMDLPIAVGLLAGTINGLINTVRGAGEIYFDSLSVLIFLLLVGRWIQFRQQNRAADAVELLYRLTPQRARKVVGEQVQEVLVDDIQLGDQLEIRPGDLIATDAQVIKGESSVDESLLSGESRPVRKRVGDSLSAGTKNISQHLLARATAIGQETRISKIVELVEQASSQKPQIVQWANRIGGYFVVIIMALAALTFAIWYRTDANAATDYAIALLVIACPCALAMATPLAISVALGKLAKRQIMVKSGDVMQSLSRPGMIWLDKTGTLTEGRMKVSCWYGDRSWMQQIEAIEQKFTHPIASAISHYCQEQIGRSQGAGQASAGVAAAAIADDPSRQNSRPARHEYDSNALTEHWATQVALNQWTALPNGVKAEADGHTFLIGNRSLMEQSQVQLDNLGQPRVDAAITGSLFSTNEKRAINWLQIEREILDSHSSPCWIAVDGRVKALVSLGDQIRPDAAVTLQGLKQQGWRIGILSGDHPVVVENVVRQLNQAEPTIRARTGEMIDQPLARVENSLKRAPKIDVFKAGVSPEEKLQIVQASAQQWPTTVMVGDGVNDSAALAAATVGIAVHNGAEASLAAAPVYLGEAGLAPIAYLLSASQTTNATIRRNLAVSLGYNAIGASLAMAGLLHPLVAAILMPISSLTVISLSLRAGTVRE
jgi:Cu2+-exporting ATPase